MITRYHVLSAEYKPSGLAAADLTSAASQGVLSPTVARSFPLAEIAAAYELGRAGSAAGRS